MKNKRGAIHPALMLFAVVGLIWWGLIESASIAECGGISGNPGDNYYFYEIDNSAYRTADMPSTADYKEVDNLRLVFSEKEEMIIALDSYLEGKSWQSNSGKKPKDLKIMSCKMGTSKPKRCANYWSRCEPLPQSEIDSIRENLKQPEEDQEPVFDSPADKPVPIQDGDKGEEQQTDTQPQPSELNLFQRIIQWFKNLFA